jgi:hypothetical protein
MEAARFEPRRWVFEIQCNDGSRHIVYNACVIGNPSDHVPGQWYCRPYPAPLPLGVASAEAYDTADDAERAVRARCRGSKNDRV